MRLPRIKNTSGALVANQSPNPSVMAATKEATLNHLNSNGKKKLETLTCVVASRTKFLVAPFVMVLTRKLLIGESL